MPMTRSCRIGRKLGRDFILAYQSLATGAPTTARRPCSRAPTDGPRPRCPPCSARRRPASAGLRTARRYRPGARGCWRPGAHQLRARRAAALQPLQQLLAPQQVGDLAIELAVEPADQPARLVALLERLPRASARDRPPRDSRRSPGCRRRRGRHPRAPASRRRVQRQEPRPCSHGCTSTSSAARPFSRSASRILRREGRRAGRGKAEGCRSPHLVASIERRRRRRS